MQSLGSEHYEFEKYSMCYISTDEFGNTLFQVRMKRFLEFEVVHMDFKQKFLKEICNIYC